MKIVNDANLPYKIIGQVIDDYISSGEEATIYVGETSVMTIDYKDILYKVSIRHLKRYVEWRFYEYN